MFHRGSVEFLYKKVYKSRTIRSTIEIYEKFIEIQIVADGSDALFWQKRINNQQPVIKQGREQGNENH
ncbi:MAG: hypothetical protein LC102_11815 [Ignavibacteriales bacterium]|nr:hypothetical protein [Ignavibacteriales bacterium]OQY74452.1 MAG: hypothetical protein B6D45_06890 [Ignavibacteriales bacterium UTCHB3]